ncbi:hypothetical protein [Candidatus Nitrosocosmicus hydrocola]|nr:hypothetical protein [Candidatus Nitrosocosmicus hydrocola]
MGLAHRQTDLNESIFEDKSELGNVVFDETYYYYKKRRFKESKYD